MNPNPDPLAVIPEAFRAVLRNPRALFLYIGLAMGVVSLNLVASYMMTGGEIPEEPGLPLRLFGLISDLVLAATSAFAQTVAFSWLGQNLDRPLWRIKGIGDAMKRFFPVWLMLDLLILIFHNLTIRFMAADPSSSLGEFMFLLFITLNVIAIPIGAAIMFHGELKWTELGASLVPLGRQLFPTVLVVTFSGSLLVVLFFFLLPSSS
ncbi:MAG: hypothetical protein U9Q79_11135, partial [Candidatus Hydrogenedentes bacterium]|nr:hypothetical protein [Candidatus Hydrogenedentota bacterium]